MRISIHQANNHLGFLEDYDWLVQPYLTKNLNLSHYHSYNMILGRRLRFRGGHIFGFSLPAQEICE